LLDEAKQVGLIDDRTVATSYERLLEILRDIAVDTKIRDEVVIGDGEDLLARLRAERQALRSGLERVNAEIRSTRNFTAETSGYEREAKEQRRVSAPWVLRPPGRTMLSIAHCVKVVSPYRPYGIPDRAFVA